MGAPRRKNLLISSRRRVDDEGEDEEGSIPNGLDDDSLSEGSAMSDADDDADADADAEASEASEVESMEQKITRVEPGMNGHTEAPRDQTSKPSRPTKTPLALVMHDTEAMMNGLKFGEDGDGQDGVHFDEMGNQSAELVIQAAVDNQVEPMTGDTTEKRRREHEEYKKKRDTDPAFVPNRGGFFMHDHRSAVPGHNGFRPFVKGRGRGRGAVDGSSPTFRQSSQPSGPTDVQWAHDLHETVTQTTVEVNLLPTVPLQSNPQDFPKLSSTIPKKQPPNRSFSKTTQIGNIQIRVYLAGMSSPITFSAVPVNQHTRLPHHRPPLRRDKPVRIALPQLPVHYIFPSTDRSFIFIPRALRPNQQGFGRAKQRGSFGGHSGLGGLSSRRTSAYAGSTYSPSVAMSRRSSLAREVSTEGILSTGGVGRGLGVPSDLGKPRVRLPPAVDRGQTLNTETSARANAAPVVNLPQHDYTLPEKPTFRENRPASIPMHQPRPQKTVSVAGIDSPATMDFNPPPQQQQQPFHQQVPVQVGGAVFVPDMPLLPHSRHASYPSQASGGTPLSQIPERAIHAQPFQPYPYQQPHTFYPQPYPPPIFFYPSADQVPSGVSSIGAPPFVPGQQYPPYALPLVHQPTRTEPTTQPGTVAHESNGMVYYDYSSQLATSTEGQAGYPLPSYPVPQAGGVIGMGGMMTPPVQYYPQPSPAGYYHA